MGDSRTCLQGLTPPKKRGAYYVKDIHFRVPTIEYDKFEALRAREDVSEVQLARALFLRGLEIELANNAPRVK